MSVNYKLFKNINLFNKVELLLNKLYLYVQMDYLNVE